jgi:hypothetical protein
VRFAQVVGFNGNQAVLTLYRHHRQADNFAIFALSPAMAI